MNDGQLVDQALDALLNEFETRQEHAALDEHPYEDDPDLSWEAPPGPSLPYDGAVPAEVIELARKRRQT